MEPGESKGSNESWIAQVERISQRADVRSLTRDEILQALDITRIDAIMRNPSSREFYIVLKFLGSVSDDVLVSFAEAGSNWAKFLISSVLFIPAYHVFTKDQYCSLPRDDKLEKHVEFMIGMYDAIKDYDVGHMCHHCLKALIHRSGSQVQRRRDLYQCSRNPFLFQYFREWVEEVAKYYDASDPLIADRFYISEAEREIIDEIAPGIIKARTA